MINLASQFGRTRSNKHTKLPVALCESHQIESMRAFWSSVDIVCFHNACNITEKGIWRRHLMHNWLRLQGTVKLYHLSCNTHEGAEMIPDVLSSRRCGGLVM